MSAGHLIVSSHLGWQDKLALAVGLKQSLLETPAGRKDEKPREPADKAVAWAPREQMVPTCPHSPALGRRGCRPPGKQSFVLLTSTKENRKFNVKSRLSVWHGVAGSCQWTPPPTGALGQPWCTGGWTGARLRAGQAPSAGLDAPTQGPMAAGLGPHQVAGGELAGPHGATRCCC